MADVASSRVDYARVLKEAGMIDKALWTCYVLR